MVISGVVVTLERYHSFAVVTKREGGAWVGELTCAIPPTFGEVGAMVILKTVESVCFFLLIIEKCRRKNTTANHQPRVCAHEITLVA